jgi:methyl-accepting chemotaxis protein
MMQENNESIEHIVKKVEGITESVAQFAIGPPSSASAASTSSDVVSRTERFNRYILSLCCT